MKEKRLYIKLLGDFSVQFDGEPIFSAERASSKTLQLFQILMLYPEGISKKKLARYLYAYKSLSNQNNCINNIIYRLRKFLSAHGLPEEEYVHVEKGNCIWKSSFDVEVDVREFHRCIRAGREVQGEQKLKMFYEAWKLYDGELLSANSTEEWILMESMDCKQAYTECVENLVGGLETLKQYGEMLNVYRKAASIYPFDGWQVGQMEVLVKMGERAKAYELYQSTVQLYLGEADLEPNQDILDRLRYLGEKIKGQYEDITEIKKTINEDIDAEKKQMAGKMGAYFCTYPGFVDIFRLVRRMAMRKGELVYLMQCVLVNRQGKPLPNRWARDREELLGTAIKETLRSGDAYTLYKEGHFLILLTGTDQENCQVIFERIMKNFEAEGGQRRNVDFRVIPVQDSVEPESYWKS